MSLLLSAVDIARLHACTTVLLSPLSPDFGGDWRALVAHGLRDLVDADTASLMLPTSGGHAFHPSDVDPRAVEAYVQHFHQFDFGYAVRRKEIGAEVWSTSMLWSEHELCRSEYWHDYKVPYRLYDALGITISVGSGGEEASIFLHRGTEHSRFSDRELRLLQLALPAFRAGVHVHARLAAQQTSLTHTLDRLTDGLLICDLAGQVLHRNHALERMLERDPEAESLTAELRRAVQSVLHCADRGPASGDGEAVSSSGNGVRTSQGRYRIDASIVGRDVLAPDPVILVILRCLTRTPLSREALQQRFRLTQREIDVTYLLAKGKTNAEVVRALAISTHTAERHTERVLMKLGLHSRAQVGEIVYDE